MQQCVLKQSKLMSLNQLSDKKNLVCCAGLTLCTYEFSFVTISAAGSDAYRWHINFNPIFCFYSYTQDTERRKGFCVKGVGVRQIPKNRAINAY